MNNVKPTVHIVDDDEAICQSLSFLIEDIGLHTQTYGTARDFLEAYDPAQSGCLVVDVRMPGMGGLELLWKLSEQGTNLPAVVITGHGDVPMAVDAMKCGAVDFIEKPFRDQDLLDAVQKAVEMDARARCQRERKVEIEAKASLLTARQQEIMNLLAKGKNSKAVAYELGINQKTVDFHRANILEKMETDSVVELALLTHEAQLV